MGQQVKFYLQSSDRFVSMLVSTSAELPRPLLADEMVGRIAQMLNYFLRHLVGPDRGRLSVKNPQKVLTLPCIAARLPYARFQQPAGPSPATSPFWGFSSRSARACSTFAQMH